MTAEHNGAPEDDDPFAYLYRADGAAAGAETAAPTQPMPGVPRTSYQQATQVGRTQYGSQQQQYAQPAQPAYGQQQSGYGYQGVPHQSPPAPPAEGGRAASRGGNGGGSGRGVMIGAVAVVLAIVIGVAFALFSPKDKANNNATGGNTTPTAASTNTSTGSASPSAALPAPADAATMSLQGTTAVTTIPGAKAAGGSTVPLSGSAMSITWTVTVPADGQYKIWIRFNNTGKDGKGLILLGGKKERQPDFKNYSHTADPTNAWYHTWNSLNLKAGQNQITIQVPDGQQPVSIDQVALTPMSTDASPW